MRPWQLLQIHSLDPERLLIWWESKRSTQSLGHHLSDPLMCVLFSLQVNVAQDKKLQRLIQIPYWHYYISLCSVI